MSIRVVKLGGTVLATSKDRELSLKRINIKDKEKIIIVVSAMGRSGFPYATDTLSSLINNVNDFEKDRLLSCGEIISSVVFSSFLKEKGYNCTSVSYLDIGIVAYKKDDKCIIEKIDDKKIKELIERYDILVVPGFVGRTSFNEIITLGRGSSDLTAVIIAKVFNLEKVLLLKDVEGVFPFLHFPLKNYIPYLKLNYSDMELLIDSGSLIVAKEALIYAKKNNIKIEVKSYISDCDGTIIGENVLENKVVGFFVKEKTFDIVTNYPCLIQEEMNSIFFEQHLIIKKEYIEGSHYYFKLDSSQLLFVKRLLINKYFSKHVKIINK